MKIDKNIDVKELGQGGGGSWTFDGISESFDNHVQKSVPFYNEGHDLICRYSDFFLNGPSTIYDIGSSTGILLRKLLNFNLNKSKIEVVGIEPVLDMVNYSLKKNSDSRGSFICDEIINVELKPAELIISYYSLQ